MRAQRYETDRPLSYSDINRDVGGCYEHLVCCVGTTARLQTGNGTCDPFVRRPDTLHGILCVCHGKAADGHGPMASILKARVPDLTAIAKKNGGIFPFTRVQKTIDGTESAGLGHGTREMPIWGPLFSQVTTDQDFGKVRIYNLAKYLQSIQK